MHRRLTLAQGTLLPAVLLLAATLVSGLAQGKPSLAVVGVQSPPYLVGIAEEISRSAIAAATKKGLSVRSPADVRQKLGDDALDRIAACAEKPECLSSVLAPLGVTRALGGSLAQSETAYLVHLWLLDLPSHTIVSRLDRSILIASRRLEADLSEAVPKLLAGQTEANGTLVVKSTPREAQVTLDDAPIGGGDISRSVAPGKHRVVIQEPGFLPTERWVEVASNQTVRLEERLVSTSGKTAEDAALSPTAGQATTHAGGGLPAGSWIAAAVGAGLLGGGLYFGLQANSIDHHAGQFDANGVDQGVTRAQALRGLNDARLGNYLFVGAGLALATAVVFAVLSPAPPGADKQGPPLAGAASSALTWSLP